MFSGNQSQVSSAATYIEDVFSTWLYTGNGSTQTITNGIDLSTYGGLVWIKGRTSGTFNTHFLATTLSNAGFLSSETTNDYSYWGALSSYLSAWNSNGFSLPSNLVNNQNTIPYASWTFRKQPKFFDVVTYTGTGANRTISHNLGSTPGCIIVKRTDTTGNWAVYHSGTGANAYLTLNTTNAVTSAGNYWNSSAPTSTVFSVGTATDVNANAGTYVAYLFASNSGGFGLAGTDNVITCGFYTGTGASGLNVTLGYEPQWVMIKCTNPGGTYWMMFDNMRGIATGGPDAALYANTSGAENSLAGTPTDYLSVTATGFTLTSTDAQVNGSGNDYIYIAIRRGPMKTPTSGTSVFTPVTYTSTVTSLNPGIVSDLSIQFARSSTGQTTEGWTQDRLRGVGGTYRNVMATTSTIQEESGTISGAINNFGLSQFSVGMATTNQGNSGVTYNYVDWFFRRAPGFFDEVCYTGAGSYPLTVNHNLGVAPELMIIRARNGPDSWWTYAAPVTSPNALWYQNYAAINSTAAFASDTGSFTTAPTSTTITIASFFAASGANFVAYLFASCPGVSKVGSYTGTGALQTVNCGFTSGARFVLIKRTDSTGDWYVYDSARGITSGNDPYLFLNSTAAEVTGTNYVDTDSTGFKVTAAAPAGLNANGGTYIFLAIA